MRILITGGFGYLGLLLGEALSSAGHEVTLYGQRHDDIALSVSQIEGDIFDADRLGAACKGADAVLHLAAVSAMVAAQDEALATRVNVSGTDAVLTAAASAGVGTFIYVSTIHVYGKLGGTITERSEPAPISAYGRTKLGAEDVCRRHTDIDVTILRLSNAYGAPLGSAGWDLVVNDLCRHAVQSGSMQLRSPNDMRDFVAAGDVHHAIEIVLQRSGKGEVFNVSGSGPISIHALAQRIARLAKAKSGKDVKILMPDQTMPTAAPFTIQCDKLKKLGYAPTQDMDTELTKTLDAAVRRWRS